MPSKSPKRYRKTDPVKKCVREVPKEELLVFSKKGLGMPKYRSKHLLKDELCQLFTADAHTKLHAVERRMKDKKKADARKKLAEYILKELGPVKRKSPKVKKSKKAKSPKTSKDKVGRPKKVKSPKVKASKGKVGSPKKA